MGSSNSAESARRRTEDDEKKEEQIFLLADDVPDAYLRCPITQLILTDPVTVEGVAHSYAFERRALETWIRENDGVFVDPLTRQVVRDPVIVADKQRAVLAKKYRDIEKDFDEWEEKEEIRSGIATFDGLIEDLEGLGVSGLARALRNRFETIQEFLGSPSNLQLLAATLGGVAVATAAATGGTSVVVSAAAATAYSVVAAKEAGNPGFQEKLEQSIDDTKRSVDDAFEEEKEQFVARAVQAETAEQQDFFMDLWNAITVKLHLALREMRRICNRLLDAARRIGRSLLSVSGIGGAIGGAAGAVGGCAIAGAIGAATLGTVGLVAAGTVIGGLIVGLLARTVYRYFRG